MFCGSDDEIMLHFGDGFEIKHHERLLLRPWLENLIDSGKIPGLQWMDNTRTLFRVPWKHQSRKTWSLGHSSVFLEWAKNTGRWKEGDPEPHYAQLKTRLRCAFSKAPDIEEMKEMHCSKAEEPFKVYRFIPKKESKLYPFGRKAIARKSIHSSLRRNYALPACRQPLDNILKKSDDEPVSCRNNFSGFDEIPLVTCNDSATDHIAEPIQTNDIPRQTEIVDTFNGRFPKNSLVINSLPTAYPVLHAVLESLSIPQVTTTNFEAITESMEVQEYYCGKHETILPPAEGNSSRPESNNHGTDQLSSLSVMVSRSPQCVEVLPEKESGSNLDLSDLPVMSIMEKVESWKMTGLSTAGNEMSGHSKTAVVDDWISKVAERTVEVSPAGTACKNDAGGGQSFRQLVTGDDDGVQDSYGPRNKKISLGKSGELSGSNVAVATPIFPLKSRYNISHSYLEKERPMPQSPNDRSVFPHNAAYDRPSFVMVNDGKQVPLENAKRGDQHLFRGAASLGWQSAAAEKRRKLEETTVAAQCAGFLEASDKCDRNWRTYPHAYARNWQKQGEEAYEETWLQNGERQNENWQIQSKEGDIIWPASYPQQNRNWQEERTSTWQVTGDRCEATFEAACEAQGRNGRTLDKFSDRNMKPLAGQNGESWNLHESSSDGNQQTLLNVSDRGRKWRLEDTNEVNVRWGILHENLTKDGPLDLSNKTDFYVHYSSDDNIRKYPPEVYAKMAANRAPGFGRTAEDPGQHYYRMERTKGWVNLDEEQDHHVKKLGHRALSMDASLNNLKAAYKKLVLRTMYVREKERELDDLEKRLCAREEAVHQKEQKLQKVLWSLADGRLPAEIGKQSYCTKVLPEVDKSEWNVEGSQRREHLTKPRWTEQTESCNQTPVETLSVENYTSTNAYNVSGEGNQIHRRTNFPDHGFDLGDGICGTTRTMESCASVFDSNQPFFESTLQRVLPSVDGYPCSRNGYSGKRHPDEPEDGRSSGVYLPDVGHSYCSNSGIVSQKLSWCSEVKDIANKGEESFGRMGMASGRPLREDPNLGNISVIAYPVRNLGEPCTPKAFDDRCFEHRTFESTGHSNILLRRNSSFSAIPVPQSGNEVTRILPLVSPDIGIMN